MKKTTSVFVTLSIILFATIWIAYDVWVLNKSGTEATISFMFYEWSYKFPIFTFAVGFFNGLLVGHFFWRIRDTDTTIKISEASRK